jgi:hypothetical protein
MMMHFISITGNFVSLSDQTVVMFWFQCHIHVKVLYCVGNQIMPTKWYYRWHVFVNAIFICYITVELGLILQSDYVCEIHLIILRVGTGIVLQFIWLTLWQWQVYIF